MTSDRGAKEPAVTSELLQHAALEQLQSQGVLAGLNLQAVADAAGVHRGLVYHYFGSRRQLLRAALRADATARLGEVRAGGHLPLSARMRRFLTTVLGHPRAVFLTALLVLDGDDEIRVMPLRQETRAHLEQDVAAGHLDARFSLDAVHAATVSLTWGYSLYRAAFAREFDIAGEELDRAVADVYERMLEGLRPPPAGAAPDAEQ